MNIICAYFTNKPLLCLSWYLITLASSYGDFPKLPAIATNGRNYFVVWNEQTSIRTILLGADGRPQLPNAFSLNDAALPGHKPSIASNGESCLVLLPEDLKAEVALFDSQGVMQQRLFIDVGPLPRLAINGRSVASDGTNYLVIISRAASPIVGTRVSNKGDILDPQGIRITPAESYLPSGSGSTAYNGKRFLIVWYNSSTPGLRGTFFDPRENSVDPASFQIYAPLPGNISTIPPDLGNATVASPTGTHSVSSGLHLTGLPPSFTRFPLAKRVTWGLRIPLPGEK
jgi:hypothetical protein